MNDTGKCMKIFCDLLDAMKLAEKLGSKELFDLLEQIGYEVADVLDKKNEKEAENKLKPTKDLINDIVGFDVSEIKPLPEYKESEAENECD